MSIQAEINSQVLACVNDVLKSKLIILSQNYKSLCYTEEIKRVILLALTTRESDMIGCLNALAIATARLAIPNPNELLPLHKYSYQGSEKLYNLLDDIRHEYRMMTFELEDKGIKVDTEEATNNLLIY